MAQSVSLAEYRNAVTTVLEEEGNRDAILLDLGKVLTQVTEEEITPTKDGYWDPSFTSVADTLLNPKIVTGTFPYAEKIHADILRNFGLDERAYKIHDGDKYPYAAKDYFIDTHVDALIEVLEESTQGGIESLIHTVISSVAREALIDKNSSVQIGHSKVQLGNDKEGGYWEVTDAQLQNGKRYLTLANKERLIVEIVDNRDTLDLSYRFRDEHNENWSNYTDAPKGPPGSDGIFTPLSHRFFTAITDDIERELEGAAHEH